MCLHPQIYSWQNKEEIVVTITVLVAIAGHVVQLVFITTFFSSPFRIPFALGKQLSYWWFFTYWGVPKPSFLRIWAWIGLCGFPATLITGHGNNKRQPSVFHTLPYSIMEYSPISPWWPGSVTPANTEVPAWPVDSEAWWAPSGSMTVWTSSSMGSVLYLLVEAFFPPEWRRLCQHSIKLWE